MTNTTPHPDPQGPEPGSADICEEPEPPQQGPCDHGCNECTRKESSISTKGIARETDPTPTTRASTEPPRATRIKLGIDFWHTVEFSRSGRTPTRRLSATRRGNPSSLGHPFRRGQIFRPDRIGSLCPHLQPSAAPQGPGGRSVLSVPRAGRVRRSSARTSRAPGLPSALTTVAPPAVPRGATG
jgi:hypothetical protein